jgi:anti-sigma factor RsiW
MIQHPTIEELIDYIHGELGAAEDAQTLAHLAECRACRLEYEREAWLSENLRRSAAVAAELPATVKARIWESIRTESASPYARIFSFMRPALAVPLAAMLAVALYFASPFAHRAQTAPMVDAMYYFDQHAAEASGNPLGERNVSPPVLETNETAEQSPTVGTATAAVAAINAVE